MILIFQLSLRAIQNPWRFCLSKCNVRTGYHINHKRKEDLLKTLQSHDQNRNNKQFCKENEEDRQNGIILIKMKLSRINTQNKKLQGKGLHFEHNIQISFENLE